jgi:hypothetical protein
MVSSNETAVDIDRYCPIQTSRSCLPTTPEMGKRTLDKRCTYIYTHNIQTYKIVSEQHNSVHETFSQNEACGRWCFNSKCYFPTAAEEFRTHVKSCPSSSVTSLKPHKGYDLTYFVIFLSPKETRQCLNMDIQTASKIRSSLISDVGAIPYHS